MYFIYHNAMERTSQTYECVTSKLNVDRVDHLLVRVHRDCVDVIGIMMGLPLAYLVVRAIAAAWQLRAKYKGI